MRCECRECYREYSDQKSRAEFKGFCSQKRFHKMAKRYGFPKNGKSEYKTLKDVGHIGNKATKN